MPSPLAPLYPPTPPTQGPTPTVLEQALAQHMGRTAERQREVFTVDPAAFLDQGNPFETVVVDLSGANPGPSPALSSTVGQQIDRSAYSLYYRREGSAPPGRLMVNIGGDVVDFYPGCRLIGPFRSLNVRLSGRSCQVGNAVLVLEKHPDLKFVEPLFNPPPGEVFPPIDLLGTSGTPTFIAQTLAGGNGPAPAGVPSGVVGAFLATGFRTVRLLIDGGAVAGNCTSFNVIPWLYEPNSALWFAQVDQAVSEPDSTPTGQRYRVISFSIYGKGYYYFQFTGWAGTGTTPGQIVQALE